MNRTHDVDFKRRDNAVLPPTERDLLLDWYFGLSRLTRKRLKLASNRSSSTRSLARPSRPPRTRSWPSAGRRR